MPASEKFMPAVIWARMSSQRVAMSPLQVAVPYRCSPAKPLRVSRNTRRSGFTERCPLYMASALTMLYALKYSVEEPNAVGPHNALRYHMGVQSLTLGSEASIHQASMPCWYLE